MTIGLQNTKAVKRAHSPGFSDLDDLLHSFNSADMRLLLAIEQDESSLIQTASRDTEIAINQLFDFKCKTVSDELALSRFLVDRFVLGDSTSDELRKRACNKILTFLGG